MGVFKSLASLSKMSREMERQRDAGADVARMQSFMETASATMATMTAKAASTAVIDGTPGTALVVSARSTGGFFNVDPLVELELMVMVGGTPAPVTITEVVPQLQTSKAQAGGTLVVKVGTVPSDLFIDWAGS